MVEVVRARPEHDGGTVSDAKTMVRDVKRDLGRPRKPFPEAIHRNARLPSGLVAVVTLRLVDGAAENNLRRQRGDDLNATATTPNLVLFPARQTCAP